MLESARLDMQVIAVFLIVLGLIKLWMMVSILRQVRHLLFEGRKEIRQLGSVAKRNSKVLDLLKEDNQQVRGDESNGGA